MKKFLFGILGLLFAVPAVAATLPAGYTELEYIESTGTQWINPSVSYTENDSLRLVMDMQYTDTNLSSAQLSGIFASAYMGIAAGNVGAAGTWSVAGGTTNANADTLRHTFDMSATIDSDQIVTLKIDNNTYTHTRNVGSGNLGILNLVSGSGNFYSKAKLYSTKVYKNVTLVRDMIPAKNASGVVGMYDTVSGTFFTNAGTGEFIAGPVVPENIYSQKFAGYIDGYFKSVDNNRVIMSYAGNSILILNTEIGKTYTLKNTKTLMNASAGTRIFSSNVMPVVGTIYTPDQFYTVTDATTWVEGVTFTAKDIYTALLVRGDADGSANHDFAYIAEGLELYEIYQAPIKIATTAYNTARFSPVVTELNDTIATIRSVVTNTINQTAAIADLQATKQTRPDENCPAGKKCLLVEDDAGQPHWYEIIENAEVQ